MLSFGSGFYLIYFMSTVFFRICLLALLFACCLYTSTAFSRGNPVVVVDIAQQRMLAPTALYSGTVISKNDARLAAEFEGRLTSVADIGTVVARGEVVATIDDTFLRQQRKEELAIIQSEQAKLALYNKEVERYQRLVKENNVAENQLDQSISDQSVTRNNIAAARARLAQIEERIARSNLRAPFAGVISERFAQIGEWSQNGTVLVRLVDTENLEIQVRVPQSIYPLIALDNVLTAEYMSKIIEARVSTIVPVGSNNSRLFELRLKPTKSLPPGTLVRVSIPTAQARQVIAVHRDALVLRKGSVSVFRINSEDIAEQIAVKVGIGDGNYIEIIGDIQVDDRIVIRGGERLRPGTKVSVSETIVTQ